MTMAQAYPVFIKKNDLYVVYIPDFDIYTEGVSIADAICMARDAMGTYGLDYKSGYEAPLPSTIAVAREKVKALADDDDFKMSDGIVTFVDIDFAMYAKKMRNKAVKKNCTLPKWLCEKAEEEDINFSKVLQDALMEKLNLEASK